MKEDITWLGWPAIIIGTASLLFGSWLSRKPKSTFGGAFMGVGAGLILVGVLIVKG